MIAALVLLATSPALAAPRSTAQLTALERELPPSLTRARLTAESRLMLDATPELLDSLAFQQHKTIRTACEKWRRSSPPLPGEPDPELLVVWPGGGSWWRCTEDGGTRLAEWDDANVPFTRRPSGGRIFAFGGGQFSFGNSSGWGITAGAGTTLYRERADVAFGQSLSGGSGSTTYTLGLSGRLRFPIDDRMGWNAGPQLQLSVGSGSTTFTAAALGGLNLFVKPGGSIDVTASVATNGNFGLLTGYTFFLEAR
jgi:hypothetical protein